MAKDKPKPEEELTAIQGAKLVGENVFKLGEAIAGEVLKTAANPGRKQGDGRAPSERLNLFAEGVGKVVESVTGAISYGVKKAVTDPFGASREDSLTASRGVKLFADGFGTMARAVNGESKSGAPIPPPQITNVRLNPESKTDDPNAGLKLFTKVAQPVDDMFQAAHNVEDKIASATGIKAVTQYVGGKVDGVVNPLMDRAAAAVRSSLKLDSNQTPPPASDPGQSQQHNTGGR